MSSILSTDFDQQITDAHDCARRSLRRLHAALGGVMLTTQPIDTVANDHLIAIDDEARQQNNLIVMLLQSLRDIATLARTFQEQRNQVLDSLRATFSELQAAQSNVSAEIYLRMRDNISATFGCTDQTADGFLHALWDQNAEVDDALAELLDRVADTIGDWDQR